MATANYDSSSGNTGNTGNNTTYNTYTVQVSTASISVSTIYNSSTIPIYYYKMRIYYDQYSGIRFMPSSKGSQHIESYLIPGIVPTASLAHTYVSDDNVLNESLTSFIIENNQVNVLEIVETIEVDQTIELELPPANEYLIASNSMPSSIKII